MSEKRVSSKDIAESAGVSRATVSYVLNKTPGRRISDEARQRVLATARALGYVPNPAAIALRSGRSRVVLLHEFRRTPHMGEDIVGLGSTGGLLRDAVAREVASWGMTLVSCGSDTSLAETLAHLSPSLVLAPGGLSVEDEAALKAASIPHYGSLPDGQPVLWAVSDAVALQQVTHVRELGHRRIAFVGASAEAVVDVSDRRRATIASACATFEVELVASVDLSSIDDRAVEQVADVLPSWRAAGVTAVLCFNDPLAGVLIRASRRAGVAVPRDLALVGVEDDPNVSWLLEPPVSAVRLEMARVGEFVARSGRARLDGRAPEQLPDGLTPLVRRATT